MENWLLVDWPRVGEVWGLLQASAIVSLIASATGTFDVGPS